MALEFVILGSVCQIDVGVLRRQLAVSALLCFQSFTAYLKQMYLRQCHYPCCFEVCSVNAFLAILTLGVTVS